MLSISSEATIKYLKGKYQLFILSTILLLFEERKFKYDGLSKNYQRQVYKVCFLFALRSHYLKSL